MSADNPTPFIADVTFHVRYAETDAMGIVHHASYIVYLEEGRSEYIRWRGSSYAEFERNGYFLAVTEVNARYIKPARYDDRITVKTWVTQARSRGVTFSYEIVHSETGDLLVKAETKHICLNQQGRISKIPDVWLTWVTPAE